MPHRQQYSQQLILTLEPPTLKYHKCRAPKNQAGVCKKLYKTFSHQNILSSHMKSWNTIQGVISSAGSMLTTCMWLKTDVVISHSMTLKIHNRGIAPPILKLHPTWMLIVNFIPLSTPNICTLLCDTHGTGNWVGPSLVILEERKIFCFWWALNPHTIQPIVQSLYQVCYPGSLLVGLKQNKIPIMNTALRVSISGKIYMHILSLKHASNINLILDN